MVASTSPAGQHAAHGTSTAGAAAPAADTEKSAPDLPHDDHAKANQRGGVRRLIASVTRLISIQLHIWLAQAKSAALKIGLFLGLFAGAAVLGILAIIFLYIGVFKVLTDVVGLRPVWAFLIYGGFHLILAAVLVMVAVKILTRKSDDDDDDDAGDADHHHAHATRETT